MKIIRTFGRSAKPAAAMIATIECRGATNTARVEKPVTAILAAVRERGDVALRECALRFDGLKAGDALRVTRAEMKAAWDGTAPELRQAMEVARANIQAFAQAQRPQEWSREMTPGVKTGQVVRALDSVGCYVPGGRYPLPSTPRCATLPPLAPE